MSQIDYILMRKVARKRVKDVKVIPGKSCHKQHRLLVGVICVGKESRKSKRVFISKCRVWKLQDPMIGFFFQKRVQERLGECKKGDVNGAWIDLRNCFREVADEVC